MLNKVCSKCKISKTIDSFNKNKAMKDGYQNQCTVCQNSYWKSKNQISKQEAEIFLKNKVESGEKFEYKSCKLFKTADGFYYQRSYGGVRLALNKCKDCQTNYQRNKSFGITDEDFEKMLSHQNNKCAICQIDHDTYRAVTQNNRRFAVDHCHSTEKIRGLLCDKCNRGIGYFKDSDHLLLRAINYLRG